MFGMLVLLTLALALAMVVVGLLGRWALNSVQGNIARNLRAAETIVNDQRIPEDWLAPYRRRVAKARRHASSDAGLSKVGLEIQQECLRRLDKLAEVFKEGSFVDGDDARDLLMAQLRAARRRWAGAPWGYFIDAVERFYDDEELDVSA